MAKPTKEELTLLGHRYVLSPDEFWEVLDRKIGRDSIAKAISENRIHHFRVGRKILILAGEVEAWPKREAAAKKDFEAPVALDGRTRAKGE